MPGRRVRGIWAGRILFAGLVVALVVYLGAVGLDKANQIASVIAMVLALLALGAPYLLPAPSPPSAGGAPAGTTPADVAPASVIPLMDSVEVVAAAVRTPAVRVEPHPHPPVTGLPPAPVDWPVRVGRVPELASAFQPRAGLRDLVTTAREHGRDVVLTQAPHQEDVPAPGTRVLAGGGGVGKSQLAAWFAHQATAAGTELVVWVNAASLEQVITTFAQTAIRVRAPGADGSDPAADARCLLDWLATTGRSWLVVLDDITDPKHLDGWWPPSRTATGWTLATTRRRDAVLSGAGRTVVDVDVYTPAESREYLTTRLTGAGLADLLDPSVDDLAVTLGQLPLALSHAAAYLIDQRESCRAYLRRYHSGLDRLDTLMPVDADTDGYGRPVAGTLLLALDAADRIGAGLARPAMALAAVLDPAGHPDALWSTLAVTGYLTARRTHPDTAPVTAQQARQALLVLHRYGLLSYASQPGPRAVRIHALTARAAREASTDQGAAARAAADALLQLWPDNDYTTTELTEALRANTTTLAAIAGELLWYPDGHPLLYEVGNSLLRAGLYATAVSYWQIMTEQAQRLLGDQHPDTLRARANLAASYWQAGRTTDAITILEKLVTDSERVLGDQHPHTLNARANLAASYRQAGRTTDAITILEKLVTDSERVLGSEHPNTVVAADVLRALQAEARGNPE